MKYTCIVFFMVSYLISYSQELIQIHKGGVIYSFELKHLPSDSINGLMICQIENKSADDIYIMNPKVSMNFVLRNYDTTIHIWTGYYDSHFLKPYDTINLISIPKNERYSFEFIINSKETYNNIYRAYTVYLSSDFVFAQQLLDVFDSQGAMADDITIDANLYSKLCNLSITIINGWAIK